MSNCRGQNTHVTLYVGESWSVDYTSVRNHATRETVHLVLWLVSGFFDIRKLGFKFKIQQAIGLKLKEQ